MGVSFTSAVYGADWTSVTSKGKGKAVPLQARRGPEVSKEVNAPRFRDNGTGWW